MSFTPFSISLLPKIEFGAGVLAKAPVLLASGKRALLGPVAKLCTHCRGSSMQTNPIVLSDGEVKTIMQKRL